MNAARPSVGTKSFRAETRRRREEPNGIHFCLSVPASLREIQPVLPRGLTHHREDYWKPSSILESRRRRPAFGRSQERLSLCRVPTERGTTWANLRCLRRRPLCLSRSRRERPEGRTDHQSQPSCLLSDRVHQRLSAVPHPLSSFRLVVVGEERSMADLS